MSDNEKLVKALEKARDMIAANRLVLGEYNGVREVMEIEKSINEALTVSVQLEYSQDDVNEMTTDMIALRKEYEKNAYRRGAEAMREAAAGIFDAPLSTPKREVLLAWAEAIRALPVPEDKS